MASIDASTSGAGGIITTADNTGTLNLQSGGTTIATINSTGLSMASGKVLAPTGPAFSAYATAAQSIANTTWTKVTLNAEEFDTNNNFDSSTNYRFTPTVAGYYQFSGWMPGPSSNTANSILGLYKNGTLFRTVGASNNHNATTVINSGVSGSALIYLNGSTDYIEMYVYQQSGGTANMGTSGSGLYTYLSGFLARSA